MKRKRYSVEQIVAAVKQREPGTPAQDIIRKLGITQSPYPAEFRLKPGIFSLGPRLVFRQPRIHGLSSYARTRTPDVAYIQGHVQMTGGRTNANIKPLTVVGLCIACSLLGSVPRRAGDIRKRCPAGWLGSRRTRLHHVCRIPLVCSRERMRSPLGTCKGKRVRADA